jgi:hypothetical protein
MWTKKQTRADGAIDRYVIGRLADGLNRMNCADVGAICWKRPAELIRNYGAACLNRKLAFSACSGRQSVVTRFVMTAAIRTTRLSCPGGVIFFSS